jgi:hypothetical protein
MSELKSVLVGKYFVSEHDGCVRSGVIEAEIGDNIHYLVRFNDDLITADDDKWPMSLAVVPIDLMSVGCAHQQDTITWKLFDTPEQLADCDKWVRKPPEERKPRIIPLPRGKLQ